MIKTPEQIELAETQIKEIQVDYNYRIGDFSIGELLKKFVKKGEKPNFEDDSISGLFVPTYQRDFVWQEAMQSRFIESVFMGVPIQPLFAFELDEDGNLELLDGVQRLSSIKSFVDGTLILNDLEAVSTKDNNFFGSIGMGHTRWATHGIPNDVNSHPHLSNSGNIAIIHNGIIENYET